MHVDEVAGNVRVIPALMRNWRHHASGPKMGNGTIRRTAAQLLASFSVCPNTHISTSKHAK